MQRESWKLKTLGLVLALAMLAGCAQEKSIDTNSGGIDPQSTPTPGPGATPTPMPDNHPLNNEAGSTVIFTPESLTELSNYVQVRALNDPKNFKINVKLNDIGSGRYTGSVKIGYYDTGTYYIGIFNTGTGKNKVSYPAGAVGQYVGKSDAEFNQWFTYQGKKVFHAFFQDQFGAVILVIDGGVDQGDGGGYTQVTGSIYYKNFKNGPAPQSMEKCWFHFEPSPYFCGAFFPASQNNCAEWNRDWWTQERTTCKRYETKSCASHDGFCAINTTSALLPNTNGEEGYRKLGTFTSLEKLKAFGN